MSGSRARSGGFTLVELLAVMVFLGILAMIAIPRFLESRSQAFVASATSDLRNLAMAQELQREVGEEYANDVGALDLELSRGVSISITEATVSGWAAVATHLSFPVTSCGVFVGTADPANAGPATSPGVVTCTR